MTASMTAKHAQLNTHEVSRLIEEEKLYGQVKGWSTHLIVATGKTDWIRDVSDEKKSIMEAVGKGDVQPANGVSSINSRHVGVSR